MTVLHVTSGLHAGASVELMPGRYCVEGAGDEGLSPAACAVIRITLIDWSAPPLELQITDDGAVSILRSQETEDPGGPYPSAPGEPWVVGTRLRFGTVALELRADSLADPVDMTDGRPVEIAATAAVLARPPSVPPARSWGARACCVGVGLLVGVTALYGHAGRSEHIPANRVDFDAEWLAGTLMGRGLDELRVMREHDAIVLSGLVRNAAQSQATRLTMAEFARGSQASVVGRWEVADDVASTIETAVRHPDVHARYVGKGHFQVEGVVDDPAAVQAAAEPLLKDLGSNVRAFDFALVARARDKPVNAAVAAGALRYTERLDGAKVFAKSIFEP